MSRTQYDGFVQQMTVGDDETMNRRYIQHLIFVFWPMRGTASEVGGIVSATSSRNTVSDNNTVTPTERHVLADTRACTATNVWSEVSLTVRWESSVHGNFQSSRTVFSARL